jgi:hypothetical protein
VPLTYSEHSLSCLVDIGYLGAWDDKDPALIAQAFSQYVSDRLAIDAA